jgi:imidazole glycerol-phosphate synthase subunit HisF
MHLPRVIPCLLLHRSGLVKTIKFKKPKYLGDPINIVKIFNDKEVDEIAVLDVTATVSGNRPNFELLEKIVSEAFMPVAYGGGINKLEDAKILFGLGIEKIIINSYATKNPSFISSLAAFAGNQSVVVSIDVKRGMLGTYQVRSHSGKRKTGLDLLKYAKEMEAAGAGELLLNSINRDGIMKGYDLDLIHMVASAINIPLIACGGAGTTEDFIAAVKIGGASAVAAGSMFVFQGPYRAVLISYPKYSELLKMFEDNL